MFTKINELAFTYVRKIPVNANTAKVGKARVSKAKVGEQ